MKTLFWVGLVVLLLGIASLFVAIPHNENKGIKSGIQALAYRYVTMSGYPPWSVEYCSPPARA